MIKRTLNICIRMLEEIKCNEQDKYRNNKLNYVLEALKCELGANKMRGEGIKIARRKCQKKYKNNQ